MNQVPIKLGPLALLLTVISICLTTLAILTYTTAGADARLAQKYAQTVSDRYERLNAGTDFLAAAEEAVAAGEPLSALPDTTTDAEGVTWYLPEDGDYSLEVGVREEEGKLVIVSCRVNREWSEDLDIGNLWPGF